MEWEMVDLAPGALKDALLLVGVPVLRNVAPIVTSLLIQSPRRTLTAAMESDGLPPVAMSYRGTVTGPLQIWTLPGPCGPDGSCSSLGVLNSDVRIAPSDLMGFCSALARSAVGNSVKLAISLEAVDPAEFSEMMVANNVHGEGLLDALGLPRYHGVHAGFNAAFLARATGAGLSAGSLFVPTGSDSGAEERAAVEALHALAPWLPAGLLGTDLLAAAQAASQDIARLRGEHAIAEKSLLAEFDASYV